MKKNFWTGILAAALVFSLGSASVLAAEPQSPDCPGHYNADGVWVSFADENGDGVCDHFVSGDCEGGYGYGAGSHGGHRQGRGMGTCLWHTAEDGSRARCADADGDGVCDTCGVTLPQRAGFVDADGDGVCDNFSPDAGRGGYCGGAGRHGGGHGGHRF